VVIEATDVVIKFDKDVAYSVRLAVHMRYTELQCMADQHRGSTPLCRDEHLKLKRAIRLLDFALDPPR